MKEEKEPTNKRASKSKSKNSYCLLTKLITVNVLVDFMQAVFKKKINSCYQLYNLIICSWYQIYCD